MRRLTLCTLLLAAVLTFGASPAMAATITVNVRYDDSTPGDGLCSLRKAIADVDDPGANSGDCAPAAFGANTIVLGSGSYSLFTPMGLTDSALDVTSTVTDLTIEGAGEGETTIADYSAGRVLQVDAGASVTVSDLTLTGGQAPDGAMGSAGATGASGGAGGPGLDGGGILNAGTLSVTDAAITDSSAGSGGDGGAGGSNPTGPGASGGVGGAGGAGGGIDNTGTLALDGVTLSGDAAGAGGAGGGGGSGGQGSGGAGAAGGSGGAGGAVANLGVLTVTATTINGDSSGDGGTGGTPGPGQQAGSIPAGTTPGPAGAGGAAGDGGAVFNGGQESIVNSTFASNVSGDGGAGGNAVAVLTAPGTAGSGGAGGNGGALADEGSAITSLQSVTLAGNDAGTGGAAGGGAGGSTPGSAGAAGTGGGVYDAGATVATIQNTLLFQNLGGNCSGPVTDAGHNLSDGAAGCPSTFAGGYPNLGPLQDNGGPTRTISLQSGSAAINQVPATGAGCPATDQRGVPRPSGSACDIGAYEVAPPKAATGPATQVTLHGATLTAIVTPNSGDAAVSFAYGTRATYGFTTKIQVLEGVSAGPVLATLRGLRADTLYHYRVQVTAPDGTADGLAGTFVTSNGPVLGHLALRPARFASTGPSPGTTISFTDTLAARTRFVVLAAARGVRTGGRCVAARHGVQGRACTRYVAVGGFQHVDVAGADHLRFSGRLAGRRLAPGAYELSATPTIAGHTGPTLTASFRIVG